MICLKCEFNTMWLIAVSWPDDVEPRQLWRCQVCWQETTVLIPTTDRVEETRD